LAPRTGLVTSSIRAVIETQSLPRQGPRATWVLRSGGCPDPSMAHVAHPVPEVVPGTFGACHGERAGPDIGVDVWTRSCGTSSRGHHRQTLGTMLSVSRPLDQECHPAAGSGSRQLLVPAMWAACHDPSMTVARHEGAGRSPRRRLRINHSAGHSGVAQEPIEPNQSTCRF